MTLDLAIRGGRVVNPEGVIEADIGVYGGQIVAVGIPPDVAADRELDARGRLVTPGFVDAHTHLDLALLRDPVHLPTLHQGITTVVLGQDGTSLAPGEATAIAELRQYFAAVNGDDPDAPARATSVADYLDRVDSASTVNVAYLVPNGNLRLGVIGWDPRSASEVEIESMKRALREGLDQGAIGLSSGLDYIPSRAASTAELTALCTVVREVDGVYVTHMRGYDDRSPVGFREVEAIGRGSGAKIHISHLMGRTDRHLPALDALVESGLDLSFDSYPYLAGCSILGMLGLPPELQARPPNQTLELLARPATRVCLRRDWYPDHGDRLRDYRLSSIAAPDLRHLEGETVGDACDILGVDLADLVCALLVESGLAVSVIEPNGLDEADLRAHHSHPLHVAGSDGVYTGSYPHPRGWGGLARYLGRYTRDLGDFSWPEAIRHLATASAERFGLVGRGRIKVGYQADIVVLDPERIADSATFDVPRSLAVGVNHVIVNGVPALIDGVATGAYPGKALRRSE